MRLIDADALIKRCMNGIDNEFIGIVNEIPTVNVLDKIRAEIDGHCSDNRDRNDGLYIAMKIIDKYREEQE